MPAADALTDEERAAVIAALRKVIADDRFPHSPRLAPYRSALAKLDGFRHAVVLGEAFQTCRVRQYDLHSRNTGEDTRGHVRGHVHRRRAAHSGSADRPLTTRASGA
jgi:hypothetical protein